MIKKSILKFRPPAIFILVFMISALPAYFAKDRLQLKLAWAQEETKVSSDEQAEAKAPQDAISESSVGPEDPALLDLDYRDVDIKEIARAFSAISGVNIIVSNEAEAKVTLRMADVDWKTALEVILDSYGLASIEKDNFIIITSVRRRREQEESGAIETKILRLNFVEVTDVQAVLQSLLSSRGKINVDIRTNSIIITDIKERLARAEEVALQLDIRTPQVLIETLVVDVKLTDAFKWGVIEALTNEPRPELDADGAWIEKDPKWTASSNVLAVAGTSTLEWSKTIFKGPDLAGTLQMITTQTEAEVLANPRVVTLDNLAAEIEIVTQIPYQEVSDTSGGGQLTSTSFLDIGIMLSVTPHITKDNFISMEVELEYSVDTGADPIGGVPIIDERRASTNVLVKDGETIAMGGLRRRDVSDSVAKIPLLGDIPLLGYLFRSKDKSVTETELVIFITPRLVGETLLSDQDRLQLEQKKKIRNLTADIISFKNKELLPLRPPTVRK